MEQAFNQPGRPAAGTALKHLDGNHGTQSMSVKGKAYVVGAWEHPLRDIPHLSTAQVHAECAAGALADAGLSMSDVDAYFCAGDAPGFGAMSMADYMGLKLKHMDSTETGGSSYIV